MTGLRSGAAAVGLLLLAGGAFGGEADVVRAEAMRQAEGRYEFTVAVRHDDSGWEHYADRWEVLSPDGKVLGTRVLLHPHVGEQPFTRSLGGVTIPPGVTASGCAPGTPCTVSVGRRCRWRCPAESSGPSAPPASLPARTPQPMNFATSSPSAYLLVVPIGAPNRSGHDTKPAGDLGKGGIRATASHRERLET